MGIPRSFISNAKVKILKSLIFKHALLNNVKQFVVVKIVEIFKYL